MSGKVTYSSEYLRLPHFVRTPRKARPERSRRVGILFHDGIVSPVHKRMTPQQPPQSLQPSAQRTIPLHCFHRVFRTRRNKAARGWNKRRNRPLVSSQQLQHYDFGNLLHRNVLSSRRPPARVRLGSRPYRLSCKLLFDHYESPANFVHHGREINGQHSLLRIDHHICAHIQRRTREPHCLAQSPLHPVTLDRASECAAHRESNSKS